MYLSLHWRAAMSKTATMILQRWGKSLAVRIPAHVAKSAHLKVGQPVEVSARDSGVLLRAIAEPTISLAQKLAKFDRKRHSGEATGTAQ
jgi:antitoxin MazE